MIQRRDSTEVLFEIKYIMPEFNKKEFIEYAKWTITNLYNDLKKENKLEITGNCELKLIDKLLSEKEKYRITSDIDHISVQYIEIIDFIKDKNRKTLKLYTSVYFYDNEKNNEKIKHGEKYWNDIWVVDFDLDPKSTNSINNNCPNCGATMIYDKFKEKYKCNYCNTIINSHNNAYWKLSNIEKVEI